MAKMMDITDKLTFGENPRLRIKDEELEVHADTATVLQIMELLGDGDDVHAPKWPMVLGITAAAAVVIGGGAAAWWLLRRRAGKGR